MFRSRVNWVLLAKQFKVIETRRPFCSKPANSNTAKSSLSNYNEAYRQLDKLDFMTAAKILFNGPPKEKKFGIDFHLVQLFFVCMPSLAVYLVAQYARYEMRKMDEELERKKKKEEEEKAKELELTAADEKEVGSDTELLEVKARLDKLEETVKEITVLSKKQLEGGPMKGQEASNGKKNVAGAEANNRGGSAEYSKSIGKDHPGKQSSS